MLFELFLGCGYTSPTQRDQHVSSVGTWCRDLSLTTNKQGQVSELAPKTGPAFSLPNKLTPNCRTTQGVTPHSPIPRIQTTQDNAQYGQTTLNQTVHGSAKQSRPGQSQAPHAYKRLPAIGKLVDHQPQFVDNLADRLIAGLNELDYKSQTR